jgi:hypothetical protein
MTKIDESAAGRDEPQPRYERWKGTWQKVKIPVQIVIGQFIGWALRHLLG